jgi:hypothetical protein
MPTNIVSSGSKPVGENAWSSVGAGAQGLAALLGSVMQAREADKAAKAASQAALPQPTGFGPGSSFGPPPMNPTQKGQGVPLMDMPITRSPISMVDQNAGLPKFDASINVAPATQPPDLTSQLQYNSPGGIAQSPVMSLLTRNYPRSMFQYGGM